MHPFPKIYRETFRTFLMPVVRTDVGLFISFTKIMVVGSLWRALKFYSFLAPPDFYFVLLQFDNLFAALNGSEPVGNDEDCQIGT